MKPLERGQESIRIVKSFEGKTVSNYDNGLIRSEYKIKKVFFDEKEGLFGRWLALCDHREYSSSQKPKKWRKDLVFGIDAIDHICEKAVETDY